MKTTIIILSLVAFAYASWTPYDHNVTPKDRTNIYFNCLYSGAHFLALYEDVYWTNPQALFEEVLSFLKENAIFVLYTPFVKDNSDIAKFDELWTWLGEAISSRGCSLDLLYYLIDTVITTMWSRIEVDQFLDLLWKNLNLYSTVDRFYFNEFWFSCPFTFWELYKNIIEPHLG